MRIGHGYDVHRFCEGRKLFLGGVEIPYELGLLGYSDADVLLHAVCDALLGAAALGDIGKHFPDNDEKYKGIDSLLLLKEVYSNEDRFDDLIGYIGSLNKWSIFKRRPDDKPESQFLYFSHNEEEVHLGFQFLLTGILSVYYDKTRNNVSRPGFTAFPSNRDCDKNLGKIVVKAIR